jgi:hypothetical protein
MERNDNLPIFMIIVTIHPIFLLTKCRVFLPLTLASPLLEVIDLLLPHLCRQGG